MDQVLVIVAVLLGAVTVGTIVVAEVARARARLRLRGRKEVGLDHYELAYLAGGPDRVAETAIGLLAREGEIRVSRGGLLHRVAASPVDRPPVEGRVLELLKGRRAGRSVAEVRGAVADSPEVTAIQHRLGGKGLLVNLLPEPVVRVCLQVLRAIPVAAAVAIVAGLVTMLVMGPVVVGSLVAFVVIWVVARVAAHLYHKDLPVRPSRAGRYHLARARRTSRYGGTGLAAPLVALYGLSHLGDPDLADELSTRAVPDAHLSPVTTRSDWSGGSDHAGTSGSPSGASGCGGGGCGGGGCGGGGGGGGGGD